VVVRLCCVVGSSPRKLTDDRRDAARVVLPDTYFVLLLGTPVSRSRPGRGGACQGRVPGQPSAVPVSDDSVLTSIGSR
jgi:hypothetical protein